MPKVDNLSKEELLARYKELDAKYNQSIKEFEHLKRQLEINEIVLSTQKKMVEDALTEIHKLSITDPLTKLYNRRFFNDIFNKELHRAIRESAYITLIIFDIDFFKLYNDSYGHQKGDDALMAVAQCLRKNLRRPSDYAFRLGGEEFGILIYNQNEEESFILCEKIRVAINDLKIEHELNSASKYLSASFGLMCVKPTKSTTLKEFYKKTDEALYLSKREGKNKTTIASTKKGEKCVNQHLP
jgi:diguanylate cyclase (GGDEF)-like protein